MAQGKSEGRPSSSHCCASERRSRLACRHTGRVFQRRLWRLAVRMRLRVMTGGEDHARCAVAGCQRAANSGGCGKGGRNARDNLKWNACFGERSYLLGGAPEDERIAALSRTTVRFARAFSTIRALICSCVMFFTPQRLPTLMTSAAGCASSRIACGQGRRAR